VRALIPAGGRGLRLRPITHTSAKQLVPIANKPILQYVIEDIAEAGITEIGIVVGDTGGEIRRWAGDGSRWEMQVTYIEQDSPRGLAHTVMVARDFLGDEPFLMYLGDNILRDGVVSLVRTFESDPVAAQILVARVHEPERFGVVELEGERVVRLAEKPAVPRSDLALAGVYLFDAHVHDAVRALRPSARGELEITDAIQALVDRGLLVRAHEVTCWWKDTGRLEDLLEANRLVLGTVGDARLGSIDASTVVSGAVVIEPGASVKDSELRGPIAVGAGARISGSLVGPDVSLGPGCVVDDAEIEDSVIMPECEVRRARLTGSLLGRGVVVERSGVGRGAPLRLMVGDHGRVGIE
jgi:glucose-1-phosphate thymidylyltransferase